ncbi:hypothetical protein HPB52_001993 [Rhipicephalus sanguineus]|uniref:Uncharacterized protein n=1 Tax=Rhipicephalus sanguineus TaxID=34632 RepID=A0A9D4SMS0_RHISA|nr:hypothetical protein HPB52_001993 [Rhipicephalus sanguineus]
MGVYNPTKQNMDRAEQELQAKLERLGAVSDLGRTESIVSEVVDKVSQLRSSVVLILKVIISCPT